ncbi:hypothetical protein IWW36_001855 [Coemansia brasiliensis]|uniref:RING-type E3 ubiquitin transferase n=1 Tax=Coemansia brasiliensis TaxID=2650707 RepID=A0A9W8LZZ7_9FUNG|nr:hypothetical protein IWW36_001855 [Coemansia brasiliensis]
MEAEVSFCRVCRGEGTAEEPLFFPCRCSGSIKYVHQSCLEEWLAHSNKKYCELCEYEYAFSPLYDPNMPESIPKMIVLRQMVVNVAAMMLTVVRLLVVIGMWLFVLPYFVYWTTRFYFWSGQTAFFSVHGSDTEVAASGTRVFDNTTGLFATGTRRFQQFDTWNSWYMFARDNGTVMPLSSYTGLLDGSTNSALLLYSLVRIVLRIGTEALRVGLGIHISEHQFNSLVEMVAEFSAKSLEGSAVTVIALVTFMAVFMLRDWITTNAPVDDEILDEVEEQINQEENQQLADQEPVARAPPPFLQAEGRPIVAENPQHRPLFEHPPNEIPALEDVLPNERPVHTPAENNRPSIDEISSDNYHPQSDEESNAGSVVSSVSSVVSTHGDQPDSPLIEEHVVNRRHSFASLMTTLPAELRPGGYSNGELARRHEREPSEPRTGWAYADEAFGDDEDNSSESSVNDQSHDASDTESMLLDKESHSESLRSSIEEPQSDSLQSSLESSGLVKLVPEQTTPAESSEDAWSFVNRGESSHAAATAAENNHTTASSTNTPMPATFTGESSRAIYAQSQQAHHSESSDSDSASDANDEELLEIMRLRAAEAAAQRFREENANANRRPVGIDQGAEADIPEIPNNLGLVLNDDEGDFAGDFAGAGDIWEAIGLRGPIINAVQYFVLVFVVISMVLAFFAWFPFICGRAFVALNPIRLVLYATHLLFTAIDTVSELVLDWLPLLVWRYIRPILPAITNLLGPAVVYPMSFMIPELQGVLQATEGSMWARLTSPNMQEFVTDQIRQSQIIWLLFPWTRPVPTATDSTLTAAATETSGGAGILSTLQEITAVFSDTKQRELSQSLKLMDWERNLWQRLMRIGIPIDRVVGRLERAAFGSTVDDRMLMILIGHMLGLCTAWVIVTYLPRALRRSSLYNSARMSLRMAKIMFFIFVELVLFPILCGYCLDLSLMPLLESASVGARVRAIMEHRWAALFTHWLLGLLFMVHFARFVLHCRQVMRPGLLWFIRDPNDPEFHPMREILEDRMLPQQYNIARSALMYCGIIGACVGLSSLFASQTAPQVFPIQWSAEARFSDHPTSILMMVFLLPVAIMWGRPNEVLHSLFSRWWRVVARATRLTEFILGERSIVDEGTWMLRSAPWLPILFPRLWMPTHVIEQELQAFGYTDLARDGPGENALPTSEYYQRLQQAIDQALLNRYPHVQFTLDSSGDFRVPAIDTVPVVPGRVMLVHVDDYGRPHDRFDYEAADDPEMRIAAEAAGRELPAAAPESSYRDRRFRREHYNVVYVPPYVRARMCAVLGMGWMAIAFVSSLTIILSLIIGRQTYKRVSGLPVHDMYALSIGLLVLLVVTVLVFRTCVFIHDAVERDSSEWVAEMRRRGAQVAQAAGNILITACVFFGIVPAVYGLVVEVYFVVLLRYVAASPEVDVAFERTLVQAMAHNWMFGVLHVWVGLSILRVFPTLWWSRQLELLFTGPPHTWRVWRGIVVFALPVLGASIAAAAIPFAVAACILWYNSALSVETMSQIVTLKEVNVLALAVKFVVFVLLVAMAIWQACLLYRRWSQSARDHAYLVGHQLHNLNEQAEAAENTTSNE